MKNVAKHCFF